MTEPDDLGQYLGQPDNAQNGATDDDMGGYLGQQAETKGAKQIDRHLWQVLAAENASDVIICTICSALVYNKARSRDHHAAWHEELVPGSTQGRS
jgi:hypothetical protein